MRHDVVIVGGGPSGSLAALNLAGHGRRILLLDRAEFPRLKPCGGGISYRYRARFPYLREVFDSVPTHLIYKVVLESPSGEVVEVPSDEPIYAMIRRIEFDAALLQRCRDSGIEVRERCAVTNLDATKDHAAVITSNGERIEAELVIGADSVNSVVAVQSGLRTIWPSHMIAVDTTEETPRERLSCPPGTIYVYYGYGGGYGYAYIFPKTQHTNLGVGYLVKDSKERGCDVRREHRNFLDFARSRGTATGESDPANLHSFLIPLAGPMKRVSVDRVLVAGDAAGFVNGFTAEGIYYAMVSGELAGKTALAALEAGDFSARTLGAYDRACEAEIGDELREAITIQKRLLPHPGAIDRLIRFARKNPVAAALLRDYAVGKISYSAMRSGMIRRALPGYLSYKAARLWSRGESQPGERQRR